MIAEAEEKSVEDTPLGEASLWPDGGGPLRVEETAQADKSDEALIIDVDGFEGPLDLLLNLARTQKVDIAKISILALAEQYLKFIEQAKKLRIELAADYLVMAAWLAYLKSRLLLPVVDEDDEPAADELAARLAFRLQRLQAMRDAAAQLMASNRLGRDVFSRGQPEPVVVDIQTDYADNLYDLLKAYAERRQHGAAHNAYHIDKRPVWSLNQAREILTRLVGELEEWGRFDAFLTDFISNPEERATALASSLSAALEMVRDGKVEIRQTDAFEPIFIRKRADAT
ncbi:MAG: segregation and condensation protein A [Hyphomicrobiales bacterium]